MEVQDALAGWSKMDDGTRDALIILAALVVVTILAMGWAFFVKRKKRSGYHQHHHPHRHHRHRHDDSSELDEDQPVQPEVEPEQPASRHRRRKGRRRRREHRPRNPTLAETGGLPPIREGPPNTGP